MEKTGSVINRLPEINHIWDLPFAFVVELAVVARMIENLTGNWGDAPAEGFVAHMKDSVAKFVGDAEQSDDLTMLAIKITN